MHGVITNGYGSLQTVYNVLLCCPGRFSADMMWPRTGPEAMCYVPGSQAIHWAEIRLQLITAVYPKKKILLLHGWCPTRSSTPRRLLKPRIPRPVLNHHPYPTLDSSSYLKPSKKEKSYSIEHTYFHEIDLAEG